MEMDGLIVDFDGKKNIVMYRGIKEYPIGGMIAEYARMHPTDLKKVLLSYSQLNEVPSEERLSFFFPWFAEKLEESFGPVAAVIISFEFMDLIVDVSNMDTQARSDNFKKISEDDTIGKWIFEESAYTELGDSTIEQLLLSAYYWYAQSYVAFKHSFLMLASSEDYEEEQINGFWSLFGDNIDFQHIDFRIANYSGNFHSLYTIKSSMSLMLFEAAHCMDHDVNFIKCVNCGEYFVPEGRSDAIYCGHPSPQDTNKSCREIGAQVTRANKEKNDVVTKEYRKVYMRYKMLTTRHPENREARNKFTLLTTEVKEWRKSLKSGTATTEDFIAWLGQF